VLYDPSTAVIEACNANLAMTALDTTNLRITFTAPASGNVLVRLRCTCIRSTTIPVILLGVLDGSTVKGRQSPIGAAAGTNLATTQSNQEASFVVTGLTPSSSYTWDAAYGVEDPNATAGAGLQYGGPNNTTQSDAWGAFQFEIWAA
jgi:hypothetical protein